MKVWILQRKFWKKIKGVVSKINIKKGVSLFEVGLAIGVASTMAISTLSLVSSAYQMQGKAQKLELASNLANIKMTQILSMSELENTNQSGTLDVALYNGYEYQILIKEEQIDLAQLAQSGSLNFNLPMDDQLPTGVQNYKGREKAGQNISETGGLVPVYRIKIIITYPLDTKGNKGTYEVESFKAVKKL